MIQRNVLNKEVISMNKTRTARILGLVATGFGALAAVLMNDYTTAAGLVGAAIAGMTTAPVTQGS